MLITPRSISRTTLPHTADEVLSHLRVYPLPSTPHPEEDLIMRMYRSAIQRIESRTRRFLGTTDLGFRYYEWHTTLWTSWFILDPQNISTTYQDTGGSDQTISTTIFQDGYFCPEAEPSDRKFDTEIDLTLTTEPYVREDLNNAALLLTAQWYENRGDQNIRGMPHWIEAICANHAWQSF